MNWLKKLSAAKEALAEGVEVQVDPEEIRRMPGQPRVHFNQDGINRLAKSMMKIGQTTPGVLRRIKDDKYKYELIDGERRWRATRIAGIKFRGTVVKVTDDQSVHFLIGAVANFNREGHTPIEISDSIEHLFSIEIPVEEIAEIFGVSVFWANEMHSLQNLHPRVRAMLDPALPKDKILPVTAAIKISKMEKILQPSLADRVLRKEIPLGQLRKETVRLSHKAGSYIRELKRGPSRRWESASKLIGRAKVSISDVKHILEEAEMLNHIENKPAREIDKVLQEFDRIQELIVECARVIKTNRRIAKMNRV